MQRRSRTLTAASRNNTWGRSTIPAPIIAELRSEDARNAREVDGRLIRTRSRFRDDARSGTRSKSAHPAGSAGSSPTEWKRRRHSAGAKQSRHGRSSVSMSGNVPVLPKLKRSKSRDHTAECPMPKAKMVLVGVVKNERCGEEPDPASQFQNLLPSAQADDHQLREHEHCEANQCGVQDDSRDRGWRREPGRETDHEPQQETDAIFPRTVRFEELFDLHGFLPDKRPDRSVRPGLTADVRSTTHFVAQ